MVDEGPRQEIDFTLGGKTYSVRPTWQVIAGIEKATGESASVTGMKIYGRTIALSDFARVMHSIIRTADPKDAPTYDRVGEMLIDEGTRGLFEPASTLLLRHLRGDREYVKDMAAIKKGEGGEADSPPAV